MNTEEKIIYLIRETLIEKYGDEFLKLSEREQNLIISDELQKSFERFRNGK